jgi:hypothetical protein
MMNFALVLVHMLEQCSDLYGEQFRFNTLTIWKSEPEAYLMLLIYALKGLEEHQQFRFNTLTTWKSKPEAYLMSLIYALKGLEEHRQFRFNTLTT